MPISQEQRDKNTRNKLFNLAKTAYDRPERDFNGSKQGKKGADVVLAARSLAMDHGSGSYDFSGSKREHDKNLSTLAHNAGAGFYTRSNAEKAITSDSGDE